jgi:hypothetical protein
MTMLLVPGSMYACTGSVAEVTTAVSKTSAPNGFMFLGMYDVGLYDSLFTTLHGHADALCRFRTVRPCRTKSRVDS